MSAYVVSDEHINFLLTFANKTGVRVNMGDGSTYNCTVGKDLDELADLLRAANYASVNYRYTESNASPEVGYKFYNGRHNPLDVLVVLKACACFDYQACETRNYDRSDAAHVINTIRSYAVNRVPGYENAPGWSIDD